MSNDEAINMRRISSDDLLWLRKYQQPLHEATNGDCSQGCGRPARGGGICLACIDAELARRGQR